jgi:hypothetical protein
MTVIEALPVLVSVPVVADVAVTVLFFVPFVTAFTSTETVHEALVAKATPDRVIEGDPPVAVGVPPQVLDRFGVGATVSPAGRLSVNATPFSAT